MSTQFLTAFRSSTVKSTFTLVSVFMAELGTGNAFILTFPMFRSLQEYMHLWNTEKKKNKSKRKYIKSLVLVNVLILYINFKSLYCIGHISIFSLEGFKKTIKSE